MTKKKKILTADDEKNITRLVQMNLERNGYEVITAHDGVDALRKAVAELPDLILLDVMMPHLDGIEVLKHLKSEPLTAQIPVIFLTVKAQDMDIFMGIEEGADFYLTKPFDPKTLIALCDRVVAGYQELKFEEPATFAAPE